MKAEEWSFNGNILRVLKKREEGGEKGSLRRGVEERSLMLEEIGGIVGRRDL